MKRKRKNVFALLLEVTAISMLAFLRNKIVDKIKYQEIKDFFSLRIDELEMAIKLLTDKNPDDKAQLQKLWEEQIKPSLQENGLDAAKAIIETQVKDAIVKKTLLDIIELYELELNESEGGHAQDRAG